MNIIDLRNEQARQLIDTEQVYSAYEAARQEYEGRFAGSMSWKQINGGTYLYRKSQGSNRSLGPQSPETVYAHRAFHEGRERVRDRMSNLAKRLNEMAPVNKALGLGRMPRTSARILRQVQASGLMGRAIDVVGTNALFAYERMAGVQINSGLLATGDIDLLFDSRRSLKLASSNLKPDGLLGLLTKVDRSFAPAWPKSYRASNDAGFMVDLIKPMPKSMLMVERTSLGDGDDLQAVEIAGLAWLVNSPKQKSIVLDDRGYPLAISVPDPRAFAMHKAWLSARADREPVKRKRDAGQARIVAQLVSERLSYLDFGGRDLSALPKEMRLMAGDLMPKKLDEMNEEAETVPGW